MNKLFNLGVLLLVIIVVIMVFFNRNNFFKKDSKQLVRQNLSNINDHEQIQIVYRSENSQPEKILNVEVVKSPQAITQGLSDREEIGADGLLFVFAQQRMTNFWMKDMLMDLDIIWIKDGVIVSYEENVPRPKPGTPLHKLPHYSPEEAIDMVLEIKAGKVKEWGLEKGGSFYLN